MVSGTEQGSGEYFVRIGVGSPPKNQYVVIDSGSDIIWVQCQPCTQCYHQSDPVFNPGILHLMLVCLAVPPYVAVWRMHGVMKGGVVMRFLMEMGPILKEHLPLRLLHWEEL